MLTRLAELVSELMFILLLTIEVTLARLLLFVWFRRKHAECQMIYRHKIVKNLGSHQSIHTDHLVPRICSVILCASTAGFPDGNAPLPHVNSFHILILVHFLSNGHHAFVVILCVNVMFGHI